MTLRVAEITLRDAEFFTVATSLIFVIYEIIANGEEVRRSSSLILIFLNFMTCW